MNVAIHPLSPQLLPAPSATRKSQRKRHLKINPRVQRFIAAYLETNNATSAAISAGYTGTSVAKQGSRLLNKPAIRAEIERRLAQASEASGISATLVLDGIKAIASDAAKESDRLRAYELLGKHLNLWTDRKEIDNAISITVERIGS